MWHFFRTIWGNVEDHVFSFRNQFIAGSLAGCGVLLRISAPDTLTILGGLWILIKATGIGGATAMGGWMFKSFIKEYLRRRRKRAALKHKKEIEDGKRKECA